MKEFNLLDFMSSPAVRKLNDYSPEEVYKALEEYLTENERDIKENTKNNRNQAR